MRRATWVDRKPLGGSVEAPDVERARVAQRRRGGARRERLVHVHEVELGAIEEVLERARHVQRQRHRSAAPERQALPHRHERRGARLGEHRVLIAALLLDPRAPLAHQLARVGGRHHHDAVPARAQLVGEPLHEAVDLVVLLPRIRGDLRDAQRVGRHEPQDTAKHDGRPWPPAEAALRRRYEVGSTLMRASPPGELRRSGVLRDESLGVVVCHGVGHLHRRRLHQVGARLLERTADAVVQRQLAAAHGVGHDARRVGRVPDLELRLEGERHVAEGLALEPDVRPLAIGEPRHVVRGADVHVVGRQLLVEQRRHGLRLGDLLGLEALALEHVEEVHVAAHVELRRARQPYAAVLEQARERAVEDRRADLRLDVVTDDRQARLAEAVGPVVLRGDEHGDAVHEAAAGLEHLLHVPLGGLLGAHRQVGDDHVGLRLLEDLDDVVRLARSLGDALLQVLAESVVGHAAVHGHVEVRHVGELHRVVLTRPDRLRQVLADLVGVDVERGGELDVTDVVATEVHVHESGHGLGRDRRPCSTRRPARTTRRSCPRPRWPRAPFRSGSARHRWKKLRFRSLSPPATAKKTAPVAGPCRYEPARAGLVTSRRRP